MLVSISPLRSFLLVLFCTIMIKLVLFCTIKIKLVGYSNYLNETNNNDKFNDLNEIMVGASRFERPTSCSQGRRANQAALRPDYLI